MLPELEKSKTYRRVQNDFSGGIWHRYEDRRDTFYDCENVTGEQYPAIAPRSKRRCWVTLASDVQGMFCADRLYLANSGEFCMSISENSVRVLGTVSRKAKTFAALDDSVLIVPDFKVLNTKTGKLKSRLTQLILADVIVQHQHYVDDEGTACTIKNNTLHCIDFNFLDYFKAGDSISISGTASNNGYFTIRSVEEYDLHFDENAFVPEDISYCMVSRTMPELQGACTSGGRVWGYIGNTIYACAVGQVDNWYRYDGDVKGSYTVSVPDNGNFTGCVMHGGHPVFFKTNSMVEIFGDRPTNFSVVQTCLSGVAQGSGASLCSVGGNILYLSENGVISCSGNSATVISEALGQRLSDGIATSDGRRYYLSAVNEQGVRGLYIYDTVTRAWHVEDGQSVQYLGYLGGDVYACCSDNKVYILGEDVTGNGVETGTVKSYVEFHPLTDDARGEVVPIRLGLRVWCDANASLSVYVSYDGGEWEDRATLSTQGSRMCYVPLLPRTCHSLGVRVRGTGNYRIHSLLWEYK